MAESRIIQSQQQVLEQSLQQTLSPQQVLEAQLLSMSTLELEERVRAEMDENPTLTEEYDSMDHGTDESAYDESEQDYGNSDDPWDSAEKQPSGDYMDDDAESRYYEGGYNGESSFSGFQISSGRSFYDILNEQLAEHDLDSQEISIAQYIIGSIDSNGLVDKSIQAMADDLAFYHGIDVPAEKVEEILKVIQTFDPAGIGARSLQECLLIQIDRRDNTQFRELQHRVIADMFEDFSRNRWDKIEEKLGIDHETSGIIMEELVRLNPRPGSSLGESDGDGGQQISPDFNIDVFDQDIEISLNWGDIPQLSISREYSDMLDNQIRNGQADQRDTAVYLKRKIDSARGFIQAIRQRQATMTRTMKAIVDVQHQYFLDGDETKLRPMILKDIADRTGYDISTISRAVSGKYAQTPFGTIALKSLFTDGVRNSSGEEVSINEIYRLIREMIENEDHSSPLTDDAISDRLKSQGYSIARRTCAKYRENLGIPVARMRKSRK